MLKSGRTYHIYNGYSETLEDLWFNNAELINITNHENGLQELEFKKQNGDLIVIDADTIGHWNHRNRDAKGYMYIDLYPIQFSQK